MLGAPIILMGALGILDTRQATPNYSPLPSYLPIHHRPLSTNNLFASTIMSHSQIAVASSSNFQLIINNALDAYKKRTKNDLLAHPLAPQLQACDSPEAIIAVLQHQIQGIGQFRSDDCWTKWLAPTVNVLFAFSSTLSAGIGLVCSKICAYLSSALLFLFGRYFHPLV